jgi:hypothetical protein
MWKLFSINKKESLVEILRKYTTDEIREAIPTAKPLFHLSKNPPKTKPPREKNHKSFTGLKGVFF